MKQLIFHVLFWMVSGSMYVCGDAQQVVLQTFLKPHATEIVADVTETTQPRLKDIDISNPLFIFK